MSLKKIILGFTLVSNLAIIGFSQSNKSMETYKIAKIFENIKNKSDSAEYYLKKSIGYDKKNLKAHEALFNLYLKENDDINAMISSIDCIGMNEEFPEQKKRLDSIWKRTNSPGKTLDNFIAEVDKKTLKLLSDSLNNTGVLFNKIRYEYNKLGLKVPDLSVNTRDIYYYFAKELIDSMICENNDALAEPFIRKAKLYELHGWYTQALSEYSRAIKINPKNPNYHLGKGKAYLILHYRQRAINEFNKTIKLDPNNSSAHKILNLIK